MIMKESAFHTPPASSSKPSVSLYHSHLRTTFKGLCHSLSTPEAPVSQFLGIKYASVPARFRQSKLFASYPSVVDASHHGPICPQSKFSSLESELFGLSLSGEDVKELLPKTTALKHDEFECLNLNITCPAGASLSSERYPVMLWIHGGGNRGSGSSWLYDGGSIVKKSIESGKPVVLVTVNFRLGFLGFASSPAIREDNKLAGDEGVGNYGLRDQRTAMEWVHHYISDFGGDPSNVTLFGESTGAADILCHLHSTYNEHRPLFHRAIVQSPMLELDIPNVHSAGWQLSRIMCALNVHSVEDLRAVDVDQLVALNQNFRAVDDGLFFAKGWKEALYPVEVEAAPKHHIVNGHLDVPELEALSHHPDHRHLRLPHLHTSSHVRSRSRSPRPPPQHTVRSNQPLMIGDCGAESLQWTLPASLWTGPAVVRRLRAICQSLSKSTALLRAYDITSYTPADELCERILELINDARFAWPTECIARHAKAERGGKGVFRYVFDQESPQRGVPHHAVDLMYLFDTVPLPALASATPPDSFASSPDVEMSPTGSLTPSTPEMCFGSGSETSEDDVDGRMSPDYGFGGIEVDEEWGVPVVDTYAYNRVRDAIQSRWIAFAHGEAPWSPSSSLSSSHPPSSSDEKVFVFGPEGETGERSLSIFDGRRRRKVWREALEPLGMAVVQKVGVELCNGPPESSVGLVKVKVKMNPMKNTSDCLA
ncbi:hypothetical protein EIP91_002250 [Steccherinum ochraceum]|uniref:Carboxylesterase type B domain-containing protein n=1 Tax=Steccherinum ochraceum TaxID=92696 RepID=A0A4R0RIU7_9APHY|nr:hypothetical protein EIP91_002250 [Steccherinum ochraceum]